MEHETSYPLTFRPQYRHYVWGGRRLADHFGRDLLDGITAESWEISDRADAVSIVDWGPLAGWSLADLIRRYGPDLLGRPAAQAARRAGGRFPLLVKIIDARERLSLQVHPDDQTARARGGEAKTEMWYVLAADPGARVFCGMRAGLAVQALADMRDPRDAEERLHGISVSAGDAIFVPGGCVHAIDAGCLLLEIQQNSDTTYRVSDWGRVDARGLSRELHLEEALQVIRPDSPGCGRVTPRELPGSAVWRRREISHCNAFQVEEWIVRGEIQVPQAGDRCEILFVARGRIEVSAGTVDREIGAGRSVLIPAACRGYRLVSRGALAACVVRARPGEGLSREPD
jgi:mannose-6-phosphate isomerase